MSAARGLLLGIDLGTQSVKAVLWRPRASGDGGDVVGESSVAIAVNYPRSGWAEQAPAEWEGALLRAVAGALERASVSARDVTGIGVTGQLDGVVAVDARGEPLSPALIWQDRRASCELALTAERVAALTGQVLDPSHLAPKARYLATSLGARVARYHQPVSYLVERLTGRAVTDPSLASVTLLFDLEHRRWSEELCQAWGIPMRALPELAPAFEIAAPLSDRGAAIIGLRAGTPVCVGTGDDFAAAIGAGVLAPGTALVSLGTAQVVGAPCGSPLRDGGQPPLGAPIVETHPFPLGGYFLENPGWSCGGAVAWARRLVGFSSDRELDEAAARVPAGSEGVSFFPALTGAMSPRWEAAARGAFTGLCPQHDRGHLARALLEGCAFACRDVVDRLDALGASVDRLRLCGGGSESALWAQLHADVLRRPVEVAAHRDATPVGAAMLAAVATGVADERQLAALAGSPRATFEPRRGEAAALEAAYRRFRRHAMALLDAATEG